MLLAWVGMFTSFEEYAVFTLPTTCVVASGLLDLSLGESRLYFTDFAKAALRAMERDTRVKSAPWHRLMS